MRVAALAAALALWGCGDGSAPAPEPVPTTAPVHGPVVAEALAALEAELPPVAAPTAAEVEDAREPTLGLVEALAAASPRDSMRSVLLEELLQPGDATVPHLAALLADRAAPPEQRAVAAEALGALNSIASAGALLDAVERSRTEAEPEHWLIAQCAWRLSDTDQDWILPRVILCLKYEQDHESVLWLADTAAKFGNYSGLEGLGVIAASDSPVRDRAAGLYAKLSEPFVERHASDAELMWYVGAEHEALRHEPSARLMLETWRRIAALGEWQLRGVDDARFVLSRSGGYAAEPLARALRDEDLYVRVHSAQCLERMGMRGARAVPALIAALDDPSVAAAAASALGQVPRGDDRTVAAEALASRLTADRPMELRMAAARALGHLDSGPDGVGHAELAALAADAALPAELRAAAAGALVRAGTPAGTSAQAAYLAELLDSRAVEVTEVESALRAWLAGAVDQERRVELLGAWDAAGELPRDERAAERQALVARVLAGE